LSGLSATAELLVVSACLPDGKCGAIDCDILEDLLTKMPFRVHQNTPFQMKNKQIIFSEGDIAIPGLTLPVYTPRLLFPNFMPMTHLQEIGAENRHLYTTGTCF